MSAILLELLRWAGYGSAFGLGFALAASLAHWTTDKQLFGKEFIRIYKRLDGIERSIIRLNPWMDERNKEIVNNAIEKLSKNVDKAIEKMEANTKLIVESFDRSLRDMGRDIQDLKRTSEDHGRRISSLEKRQAGFSFAELMTVLIILSLLILLAMGSTLSARKRAQIAATKTNMHAFRTMVEIYALQEESKYPGNVLALEVLANSPGNRFWKTLENPFSGRSGRGESYDDEPGSQVQGLVTYQALDTGYLIYGYQDQDGKIQEKGRFFYLSNS